MPFIGIITEENKENSIRRALLEELKFKESSILFIKEKSIENIKNIKFDTIIIDREFKNIEMLKIILKNSKYLIINTDKIEKLNILENLKITVITYGFNPKATITASSVNDEEILVCIQRSIIDKQGKEIEPQEIKKELIQDVNCTMAITIITLIYKNN